MDRYRQTLTKIWDAFSGEAAWQSMSDLARFHRIQASPGYRRAAQWLHHRLVRTGLQAEILSYPAERRAHFWAWPSFQEWDCSDATLHLLTPRGDARLLADFRACPLSLIQRSTSFEGDVEVVLLEDGEQEADYQGRDVAGKMVLTRGDVKRVEQLAVERHGAVGLLFDGMRTVQAVRPEGDLLDDRQYTSFWWDGDGQKHAFGFVLTPRQGHELRQLFARGEPVRVRARVVASLYDGSLEVVTATIPGELEPESEILVVAHLCHPQPSANDNASGAAAILEAARTLQSLVEAGSLPRPRRTIRFVWMAEMTGMIAYLSGRQPDLGHLLAGLNLDMVGEAQDETGSSWLIERPPDAAASFAPDLLAWLRDQLPGIKSMPDISRSHTGLGSYPLYRQAEVPFSGGSDHLVLSDPAVGVPTPMLIQWPDRFYHTSADTPDRADPHSLARSGTLAAAYAYWLATAGSEEVAWLGHEMVARFRTGLLATARQAVTGLLSVEDSPALSEGVAHLDRHLAYLLDRQKAALLTLQRLAPVECLVQDLQAQLADAARRELAWARDAAALRAAQLGLPAPVPATPRDLTADEQAAAGLCPVRLVCGPLPFEQHRPRLSPEDQDAWHQRTTAAGSWRYHTVATLALFWADGRRSLLDICDRVELESGVRDVGLVLHYFRLLEKLGYVALGPCPAAETDAP